MTRLPLITCPACAAEMTVDVLFGHAGAREAVLTMAGLDPSNRLLPAALRYVALFAPAKQRLRMDRLAALLDEVAELVRPATLKLAGQIFAAPRAYWVAAMDEMTGPKRQALALPMQSHGYLKRIVAGMAERDAARDETRTETQRAGRTPTGGLPPPPAPEATPTAAPAPRMRLTEEHRRAAADALAGKLNPPTQEPNP